MEHIILSPHADDSVACCGGTIAQLISRGEIVKIYTLFCATEPPYSPFSLELHQMWGHPKDVTQLRHAEDVAAAACLGTEIDCGMFPEVTYRRDQQGN